MDLMESEDHSDVNEPVTANRNGILKQGDSSSDGTTTDLKLSHETKAAGETSRKLPNVLYVYREDIVRSNTNSKIGIVTQVAGDSDSNSSITDDEDEGGDKNDKNDQLDSKEDDVEDEGTTDKIASESIDGNDSKNFRIAADQVRVLWMDESVTTENTKDVTIVDRGLLHGDCVASASDPMGQIGIVVDVNILVDLLMHDGSVLEDVSTRDLKRIRDFTIGDHVVLGPWLGRIEDICDNVNVLFDDGSACKVFQADPLRLKPVGRNILEDGNFPYYPGQCVKASSSSVFKNSRWLSGLWKANRLEGTVTKVTVGSLFIYWIASAGYGPDSATTPAEEQSPKNLRLLSCFAHTNWNLGDWCLIPPSICPSIIPSNRGSSKLEFQYCTKNEPESTKTAADESDVEFTPIEESIGLRKTIHSGSETSLTKNCETSQCEIAVESSLGKILASDSKGSGQEMWPLHRKKIRKVVVRKDKKSRKKLENFEKALLIINTKTKVDVAWQDGTINRGLESTSLIPIDTPGDHEFVAEQYVVEKAADDSDDGAGTRRIGVVKSVNAKEKTACVQWLKPNPKAEDAREFDNEEVVSVYELEGHPDYDYCYGDVVVRLSPVSLPTKMDYCVHSIKDRQLDSPVESKHDRTQDHETKITENASASETFTEFSDMSWVGHITGLKDGGIEVTWADGMISTVGPQAIYVVGGRDDDETIATGSYGSDDTASWETVEDDNVETVDNANEGHEAVDDTDKRPEIEGANMAGDISGDNGALSVPLRAIGFMTRLASGIFSMGQKQSDSSDIATRSEESPQADEVITTDYATVSCSEKSTAGHEISKPTTESGQEECNVTAATDMLGSAETSSDLGPSESDGSQCNEFNSTFKGFDIVQEPSDHNFLGTPGCNNTSRKWLKKVQQDWDILQNNLPEGIYVRVYEDRMDLLRAVIVGAYGTPYQDGLFFFDFLLPTEYPDVPPSAYYHSRGWRINPNLYEEGRVCLSLLNTWTGKGNEVWDPSTSSILQVLVSLQGLVLNSKPYFNEAGYDKQIGTAEGEKNSLAYNENAFLLNCKMMMYLMRRRPKHFEELVVKHFRNRGYYILKACDAYMKGHLIGSLTKDASITTTNASGDMNSVGFKLMLGKIIPKLFSALNEVGADCQEFKHLIQS
ncbi:probable ubiquitin-conjugating enzyme E2 23 [Andrographis paniculata]|uniref:probable ubiquitin-conjugating enzyme E2 23 n=1 Tax=Andrographis paniculata TaxID=175694 RepID=UPI0021E7D2A7|nr:probable ubiquitin-conjugating enzyme E2 23 [Andrographis paniculata]